MRIYKKNILWMKAILYQNKMKSHFVIIVPTVLFTPKSSSKLRSARHYRYSIVIPRFIPRAIVLNPDNHYNHGFHNTFDYNLFFCSDFYCVQYTDYSCSRYTLIGNCNNIVTMKITGLYKTEFFKQI